MNSSWDLDASLVGLKSGDSNLFGKDWCYTKIKNYRLKFLSCYLRRPAFLFTFPTIFTPICDFCGKIVYYTIHVNVRCLGVVDLSP